MFNLETVKPKLPEPYAREDKDVRLRRFEIACVLGIVGTLSGVSLDYAVNPELIWPLLWIRVIAAGLIAGLFGIRNTAWGRQNIIGLNIAWALVINFSICSMVYLTGGALSPYYAGLNLVLLGAGVLLPWTFCETLCVSAVSLFAYVLACVLNSVFTEGSLAWVALFNNSFFVFLTGLISTVSSYFTNQGRIKEFNLRIELDERNRELEDMDRLKSDFFSNMSHELRTPLTLILSPLQDLLRQPEALSSRAAELIITARDNSFRLLKLVNDLLEVIRLEEGKEQIRLNAVDINEVVRGLVDSMQHLADQRGIRLVNELSDSQDVIDGDIYAVERIFLNLLSNAVKFTPDGGHVTIRSSHSNQWILIEIIDTGIGIKKDDISFIFDRFRQVDSSSTRKYRGSGLGLALVKELTEKMGGSIEAVSEQDRGTTMKVSFPFGSLIHAPEEETVSTDEPDYLQRMHQSAEQRAALPMESPFEKLEGKPSEGKGPTLLIVDDEPAMRQYLSGVLESDYRVSLARDGKQALDLARKYKPDLMLLDLMLPEIDGHEVCRQLKQDPDTRSIKIVLLTARIDEKAKIIALENGADDFLTKPFSRIEIETRLRNLLDTSRLESEVREQNLRLKETLSELKTAQANLVQSEKLNALGSLSAGLLHEVNNPLNYVIAALQMLTMETEGSDNEDVQEYLVDINEGVSRIRNIVTDLHTFAHPTELDKQKQFSLSSAIESAMRFTSHEKGGVTIKSSLSKEEVVVGSQGHIIQILINLISNGIRAINAREDEVAGKIEISSEKHGQRVHLIVKDNGIGMTEDVRKRIFDPFFTTRDVGEGMGLGLSICHTIMKNHGGEIIVTSELGVGTEFVLDLPITYEENSEDNDEYDFANE